MVMNGFGVFLIMPLVTHGIFPVLPFKIRVTRAIYGKVLCVLQIVPHLRAML